MTATNISRTLHLTYCNKAATTQVKHAKHDWNTISALFTSKPKVTEDRETLIWPLFVPFKMTKVEDGAKMTDSPFGSFYSRSKANVEHMDLLVIDIDNDPKHQPERPFLSLEDAKEAFKGLACVIYTSYNHRNPYKHNTDKYRVVLPLAEPVTLEDVELRKKALSKMFPSADPASFTASQPFYVPIVHPDRVKLHHSWEGKGEWFDLLALEAIEKPEPRKSSSASYVQTGATLEDLPNITLGSGQTFRADELYAFLQEGYENKKPCYRIGGADKSAGCFIYRHDSGLRYYDNAVGRMQFIKVMKTERVSGGADEQEVETTPLWRKKQKPAAVEAETPSLIDEVRSRSTATELVTYTSDIVTLNERYLPDDLHIRIPKQGVTVIRSPKGTGKTELLKKVTAQAALDGQSVMLLGHRVFLLENLATRTNLDYYRDLEDGATTPSMTLCLNSLKRVDPKTDSPYDTIIIDESEQVFQALTSKTLYGELSTVFNNLIWLFRNAKRIICLDADLSAEMTIELIEELRGQIPNDEVLGVINEYRIGEGQTTHIYASRMHLLADTLEAIDSGKKVFIPTNNKKFATVVDAIVRDMGKSCLLVTAETSDGADQSAFINNPTEESQRYDVVVSSPTLSTGISIDGDHFDLVAGFMGLNPGTFQDADQSLSRVRKPKDVRVWIQGNKTAPTIRTEESIYDSVLDTERGSIKRLFDEDTKLTQGQLLWARIYSRITYLIQLWSVNKDEQFVQLRTELGFSIAGVPEDEGKRSTAALIYASYKDIGTDHSQAVFDARVLDPEEAMELGKKKQRSHEENLAYERYRLQSLLKDAFSLENVRKAIKQELLRSVASIRTLHLLSDDVREHDDRQDRAKNKSTFTANRHRVIQKELIDHLCAKAKVDISDLLSRAAKGDEIEIGRETMLNVAKAYDERKRDFNFYFSSRIKDPTNDKSIKKVWDATFGERLSLPLVRKKKGPRDQQEYHYYIDTSKKDLVHAVMADLDY